MSFFVTWLLLDLENQGSKSFRNTDLDSGQTRFGLYVTHMGGHVQMCFLGVNILKCT